MAINYFVATSGGNDANDGKDVLGLNIDASWTASTKRLDDTGAFSSYTWESGDQIFLSHASITDGIYEIASKISNNIIELVNSIHGSDQSNVTSSNGPFDTIGQAVSVVAADDEVRLCTIVAGEEFSENVTLTTSGSTSGAIKWIGANDRGVVDGTVASIDASSGVGIDMTTNVTSYQYFELIKVRNATSPGFDGNINVTSPNFLTFYKCEATGCSISGFGFDGKNICCVECRASSNGTRGFWFSSNVFNAICINCFGKSNGSGYNFQFGSGAVGYGCISIAANTGGFNTPTLMANCVAYDSEGPGLVGTLGTSDRMQAIINCIFSENNKEGIDRTDGIQFRPLVGMNNAFYNNVDGELDSEITIDRQNISLSTDPFTNAVNDNFELNHTVGGLECRNAGIDDATASSHHIGSARPKKNTRRMNKG